MEEYQFTTLSEDEMNRVNGAWLANAAGAIAGGVGGFFGAIISGGQDATAEDLAIGAFSGFMMQRGRMVILGDAGKNLGDSMYDGTIYVGGKIADLGVDAVEADMTDLDCQWLKRKLELYEMEAANGIENMTKIVAGKQLWNYDNLEPSEKKLIL